MIQFAGTICIQIQYMIMQKLSELHSLYQTLNSLRCNRSLEFIAENIWPSIQWYPKLDKVKITSMENGRVQFTYSIDPTSLSHYFLIIVI